MAHERYIEKLTHDEWLKTSTRITNGVIMYGMKRCDDGINATEYFYRKEYVDDKFVVKPCSQPFVYCTPAEPRHPIIINLRCPECGQPLKPILDPFSDSIFYEHKCSNKECHYETTTKGYFSGMIAAVTPYIEQKLMDGTYNCEVDGKLTILSEKDLLHCGNKLV